MSVAIGVKTLPLATAGQNAKRIDNAFNMTTDM
jgi:hypothetical protein